MLKWQIGTARITQIVELTTASLGPHLLPQATPEAVGAIPWMSPFLDDDNRIVLSMHTFLVESGDQVIMVDTCLGNDKPRRYPAWNKMQGDFLERMEYAGFATSRIDTVLCTHMHLDHVGWNTRLVDSKWVPTFPSAQYLYAEDEWEFWRNEETGRDDDPVLEDSVQPIFDAGLAQLVGNDHVVNDEIRLESTPGHTPGHVSIHITSAGEEAIITGDMMHHPCQIPHPDWASTFDHDTSESTRTRESFLSKYADKPTLILGTHFTAPTAGRIVTDGDTFRLDY
jgi:glyoxylase-like metal-dependent hydrolase (beta-lactamase superfamily II)